MTLNTKPKTNQSIEKSQLLQHNKVLIYEFVTSKFISFSIIPDMCTYMYLFSDTASK